MDGSKSGKHNVCLCHKVISAKGKVTPFTAVSWKKFQEAALIWKDDVSIKHSEYLKHDTPYGGYHRQ